MAMPLDILVSRVVWPATATLAPQDRLMTVQYQYRVRSMDRKNSTDTSPYQWVSRPFQTTFTSSRRPQEVLPRRLTSPERPVQLRASARSQERKCAAL